MDAARVATPNSLRRLAPLLLAGLSLVMIGTARAQEPEPVESAGPLIREIVFRGNEVTLDMVMRRELAIEEGQIAETNAVELSRQRIQDLGLFRKVTVEQEALADGVRVVFTVREKWFVIPYPRLSANSDGQNSVGAELRWNNLGGRNHSLRTLFSSADRQDEGRGREVNYEASYRAPFLFGSLYTLDLMGAHAVTPVEAAPELGAAYDERVDQAEILLTRKIGRSGAASQGWRVGGGTFWRHQDTSGLGAPDPYGDAIGGVALLQYRDLQDHTYSETGTRMSTRFEFADQSLGSDYSFTRLTASYRRSDAIGQLAHQTLELGAEFGASNNGPADNAWDYALGGTSGLRGYPRDRFAGDAYYLFGASYLRPLYWNWLRLVVGVEAGNAYEELDEIDARLHWSFNLGLRVKATRLVNFEFEAGIAIPIDDDSGRIYGSRNGF